MKFSLTNSGYTGNLDECKEVLDKYNVKAYKTDRESWVGGAEYEYEVEIASLKQLMSFIKDIGYPIIIFDDIDGRTIEIYDGWRE